MIHIGEDHHEIAPTLPDDLAKRRQIRLDLLPSGMLHGGEIQQHLVAAADPVRREVKPAVLVIGQQFVEQTGWAGEIVQEHRRRGASPTAGRCVEQYRSPFHQSVPGTPMVRREHEIIADPGQFIQRDATRRPLLTLALRHPVVMG